MMLSNYDLVVIIWFYLVVLSGLSIGIRYRSAEMGGHGLIDAIEHMDVNWSKCF